MTSQIREEPRILAAAERRMQAWVFTQQMAERTVRVDRPPERDEKLGDFITISREAGACGSQIAELVGHRLGWDVFDKNLLDQVAAASNLARLHLDAVDETSVHWVNAIFGTWPHPNTVSHDRYVVHLRRVVMATVRRASAVFVGRGAQFLLPRGQGLAVRLVAPMTYRVDRIARRVGISRAKARQHIACVDRGRREFVRRFFNRNIDDPHLYDLVINVERFGPEAAAERIVGAYPR